MDERDRWLNELKIGSTVILSGGIYGDTIETITKIGLKPKKFEVKDLPIIFNEFGNYTSGVNGMFYRLEKLTQDRYQHIRLAKGRQLALNANWLDLPEHVVNRVADILWEYQESLTKIATDRTSRDITKKTRIDL